jgi:hypothetical protein
MKFNIFESLEKDDKELIHSAFIKYLLQNHDFFTKRLFPKFKGVLDKENVKLEVSYSAKIDGVKKQLRIDIEAFDSEKKEVLVVENKFKSFPYLQQLVDYDQLYKLKRPSAQYQHTKYLVCFDPSVLNFDKGTWNILSYADILDAIDEFLAQASLSDDHKLFIEHYRDFLRNSYYIPYHLAMEKPGVLIQQLGMQISELDARRNKMWLKLFYSKLLIDLQHEFRRREIPAKWALNPGNTTTPLINIIPQHWVINGVDTLIQFQGNSVKFYAHCNSLDKEIFKEKVSEIVESFAVYFGKSDYVGVLKKQTVRVPNSCYVVSLKLSDNLALDEIGKDDIFDFLILFYDFLDGFISESQLSS